MRAPLFRRATIADHPWMFELHETCLSHHIERLWGWDEAWQRDDFQARWDSTSSRIVVFEGGDAGYLQTSDDGDGTWLWSILLEPRMQRRGVGTWALRELQRESARRDHALSLKVFTTNVEALALYSRLGFRERGRDDKSIALTWGP